MGVMCSDPGHRPGVHDLRYTEDIEFDDYSDCDSLRQTPSISRVPIPVNQLRVYRVEKKTRESFFDLDSVDEDYEVVGKAKCDIVSLSNKSKQPTTLEKVNSSKPDSKQESNSLKVIPVNCQNPRLSETSSVCSDQPGWNYPRSALLCSDREVNMKLESSGNTKKGTVCPRGKCTDKEPIRSVCGDQPVYMGLRESRCTEKGSGDYVKTPEGYCTDEISYNASVELTDKSDSESDSLKFVVTQSEARKSLCESTFKECRSIDNQPKKSASGMTQFLNSNKPKPNSYLSDTDSTSINSGGSLAVSPFDTYQRCNGSSDYPEPNEQRLKGESNSVDNINDFAHTAKVPLLILGGTTDEATELDGHQSQYITMTGQAIKENEAGEGLIFDTPGIVNTFINDCQKTEYLGSDISNVVLP